MIPKLWETVFDYFKERPYWSKVRPIVVFFFLYIIVTVLAYQFIKWQYGIEARIELFLRSYIFKQITLVFMAIGVILCLFALEGKRQKGWEQEKVSESIRKYTRMFLPRAIIVGLVAVAFIPMFLYLSPSKTSRIHVRFLSQPGSDFNEQAFIYLIYELNKLQKNWYFEVSFDVFNERSLRREDRERCEQVDKSLCYAELLSQDRPFIGITSRELDQAFFFKNRNKVSVISTYHIDTYAPLSNYEFLVYSLIIQSMLIHLNQHCTLPPDTFEESREAHGGLFQFMPDPRAMKSTILASRLNKEEEELFFNCFGAEYVSICSQLLTLEWLRAERVTKNLEKYFKVKL